MIRKRAEKNTVNPPGQIVNFEVPLVKAIKTFNEEQAIALLRSVADKDKCDVLVPQGDMVVCTPTELAKAFNKVTSKGGAA